MMTLRVTSEEWPAGSDTGNQWYCLKAPVLREHLAAGILREHAEGVADVFMPRIRFQRNTRSGKKWFQEALFPGYFFARFDYQDSAYQVRSAPGILKIVEFGGYAPPIAAEAISQLAAHIPEEGVVEVTSEFKVGGEVRITEGPFAGLLSVLKRVMPGRQRVQVLLEFLGNPVLAEVGMEALEHPDPYRLKGRAQAIGVGEKAERRKAEKS